ncbi:hypothetical protein Xen7305DRAFT_00048750 [Xenococcus sp. PCC 7305]|uniref:hypothetical protein n=1 Tax=Xenococcus sp. PCC 7305 TaxID=102125 RepID=UPI0002AC0C96|nr:hypothetical protein [Xenococcus sp. PCC 7305]ELS05135.1 hypothetical protein Xen7305DRAFT_00048750 [Xenococcus sp. PCC 7305]
MRTIRLRSHVDVDGSLQLQLNDLPADQDIEIVLVYQPVATNTDKLAISEEEDPIIGLFSGSPNLAEQSEEILQQEIQQNSGWTWKQS